MRFFLLFFLSACVIGASIPTIRTDNPRQGWYVTDTGKVYRWTVTQPEIVAQHCRGIAMGCVIIPWHLEGDKVVGEIWLVDSFAVAVHECAHVLAFDGVGEHPSHWFGELSIAALSARFPGVPAPPQPCGPSALHTDSDTGGRAMEIEEWEVRVKQRLGK